MLSGKWQPFCLSPNVLRELERELKSSCKVFQSVATIWELDKKLKLSCIQLDN